QAHEPRAREDLDGDVELRPILHLDGEARLGRHRRNLERGAALTHGRRQRRGRRRARHHRRRGERIDGGGRGAGRRGRGRRRRARGGGRGGERGRRGGGQGCADRRAFTHAPAHQRVAAARGHVGKGAAALRADGDRAGAAFAAVGAPGRGAG